MITAYTLFCYRVKGYYGFTTVFANIRSIPPSRKFVCQPSASERVSSSLARVTPE